MRKSKSKKKHERKQRTTSSSRQQVSSTLPVVSEEASSSATSAVGTQKSPYARNETFEEFLQRQEKAHFGNPHANEFFRALEARDIPRMDRLLATKQIDLNCKMGSAGVTLYTPQFAPTTTSFTVPPVVRPTTFQEQNVGSCAKKIAGA